MKINNKFFKYLQVKTKLIKNKFNKAKNRINKEFKEYFLLENSLCHLNNLLKAFFIISIGFKDIKYGIKNPKRFKINIFVCIFWWISLFRLHILLNSNYIFVNCINNEFLPDKLAVFYSIGLFVFIPMVIIRIELLLGEIKYNLSPLKVFYFLMNNIKAKHQLNQANYKRLGIFSRLIIFVIDLASIINILIAITFNGITAIRSRQLFWIVESTVMIPFYVLCTFSTAACCIVFIVFFYYQLRFQQINDKVKSINKLKIFNKSRQRQLNNLIDEHNSLAIEIRQLNLLLRRFAATFFINSSLTKIVSLYTLIYIKSQILILWSLLAIIMFFTFGFGLSYLFTQQIKSAHRSYKIIHSIVCKHKMKLKNRLKVQT